MFNGARAHGVGFWGSTAYSFGGSLIWEVVMENEVPSINDQITTPFGGALLGEALRRFGRSLRWRRGCTGCQIIAAALDPMGTFVTFAHGEAWALTEPPPRFGYLSLGWNGVAYDVDDPAGGRFQRTLLRAHAALSMTYGLPLDDRFKVREPLDYFDVLIEGNISKAAAPIRIHARGLLWGREFRLGAARGLGGAMAYYDFADPETIRVGAFSVGGGALLHVPLGDRNFVQAMAGAGFIPYGTAGAGVDEDMAGLETERDYHRGVGSSQILDLKLGRRGLGMLHLSSRGFFINGEPFEEGSEYVNYTRFGVMAAIYGRSGIDLEVLLAVRRANFVDDTRDLVDSSAQLRISYVYTSDMDFGGGLSR